MLLFRVDNRLVHGQVIEAWLPFTGARHLVVANDELAEDVLRQQIVALAVPQRVQIHFSSIADLPLTLKSCHDEKIFVVLANCQDMARVLALDIPAAEINVGNLHYSPNKRQILPHVAVSEEEFLLLREFASRTHVDFRSVPAEKTRDAHELLQ